MYRQRHARQTKDYLRKYPHSTSAERMKLALDTLEHSLEAAIRHSPSQRVHYDNASYRGLLRRLSQNRADVPVHRAANVHAVLWERYVKLIAVRVLHYLARNLMNHREPLHLPVATPVWNNDFEFQGQERAPEPNLPLRRVVDDIHFVLRSGQQPNGQPIVLTPGGSQRTFMGILAQPHVQQLITRLADEQALSREDVEARATKILRQIGDNVNHAQARTLAYIMRKTFKQVYTRVSLNPEAYDILHRVYSTPRTAVVLMPSHRSYMDFIILSYSMLTMGFPLPHICAGEDFLRLGAVADYLRGSGAFFMRRTFKGDALYAALFKEYVRSLVRKGESLEFFIEGTRSRTQKTLPPKLGFLKIVTDAFLEKQNEVNDVLILPISLSYEKVLEGNLYADELLGLPKPKETPMNLLRSATVLQQKFGSFNVNVAEPISLADFVKDPHQVPTGFARKGGVPPPAAAAPSVAPAGLVARAAAAVGLGSDLGAKPVAAAMVRTDAAPGSSPTPPLVLQRLAWRVTYELERHLVVTPTALAAAVVLHMFDHTMLREDGVPFADIASRVEWLRSKVLAAGGLMNHRYAAYDGPGLLSYALKLLNPHLTVSPLNKVFMSTASIATYMALSMYTNQLVHLFADESAIAVAANALAPAAIEGAPAAAAVVGGGAEDQAPVSSNVSTGGEGPDAAQSAAAAAFQVSSQSLQRVSDDVRRLMSLELPDFQSPSPVDANHSYARTLSRMSRQRCVDGMGAENTAPPSTLTLLPNQYFAFAAQLLYPCIESYFVVHVALAATLRAADSRIPESVLLVMAHKLSLRLYDAKLGQYVASSNKEALKNALTRAYETKTVAGVKGGRASMTALPKPPVDGVAVLAERLRDINSMRCRPASAEDLTKAVDSAVDLYAGMSKLSAGAKL
jgi:glycerone phosphate O-acyltransferase